jgi:hypothetical protein
VYKSPKASTKKLSEQMNTAKLKDIKSRFKTILAFLYNNNKLLKKINLPGMVEHACCYRYLGRSWFKPK